MRPHQALKRWLRPRPPGLVLLGVAWMVVALTGLSFISSLTAFREPNYSMAVDSVDCERRAPDGTLAAAEATTLLPFVAPAAERHAHNVTRCRFDLDLTRDEIRDLALLIPSFTDSVTVEVNGERVALTELHMMRNLRFTTLPAFVPLSDDVLVAGRNEFRLKLSARSGRDVELDRLFIGATADLRPYYHARWFAAATLPTLVVGGEMALGLMFALIWAARPRETELGWLAATLVLGAARGSVLMPDFGLGVNEMPFWNMLVVWEITTGVMFCRALAGARPTRLAWLLWAPPLLLTLLYLFGPFDAVAHILRDGGMAVVFAYMAIAIGTLARAALRGNGDALVVVLGLVVLLAFILRDFASILQPEPTRAFLTRATFSGFVIAVGTLMMLRFVRAMRELDNTGMMLRERVAAVEAELRDTYEELRVRREAEAVDRERARLMRDLHDGLGGDLASMLALADAPKPRTQEIARHARAALTDMRLIISSLEDYGGDLSLALGAWRERMEPQLRAAGLSLTWAVGDVAPLEGLGPAQVLDILRILQEAVTNAIKHAAAGRVRVEMSEAPEGVVIAVCDDGPAFSEQPGGKGLRNMHKRAARLNAALAVGREGDETCVRLTLPRAFAAAG